MPLKITEANLDNVKPDLHALYMKQSDGKFKLDLPDLETYVESQLKPLKLDLERTREHERKLLLDNGLGEALRRANILPGYEALVIANFEDRVALETVDNKRVIRILQADGGTPMVGSGPNGLATLADLAAEAAKTLPSTFAGAGGGTPSSGSKILKRSEFDKLSPIARAERMHEGYKLVDDQAGTRSASRPPPKPGEKIITREAFDKLSPIARSDKILKEGFKVVD
jgi:hypothetical protein